MRTEEEVTTVSLDNVESWFKVQVTRLSAPAPGYVTSPNAKSKLSAKRPSNARHLTSQVADICLLPLLHRWLQ